MKKNRRAKKNTSPKLSKKRKGVLISFEGVEATGKSTQVSLLSKKLQKKGYRVYCTQEPGGSPLAQHIRSLLLSKKMRGLDPLAELFLYEASRVQHVQETILPQLEKGKIILCDRFIDSSWVYQGLGRNIELSRVETLNRWATRNIKPTLSFVFLLSLQTSLHRLRARGKKDRMEEEKLAFHKKINEGYRHLIRNPKHGKRIVKINANQSTEKVTKDIWNILEKKKIIT